MKNSLTNIVCIVVGCIIALVIYASSRNRKIQHIEKNLEFKAEIDNRFLNELANLSLSVEKNTEVIRKYFTKQCSECARREYELDAMAEGK